MLLIECLLWYKHVTLEAPGVCLIPLLQDYYDFPRVSGEESAPAGLSVRTLSLGILPQGTSTEQVWQENTPYTVLVPRP